MPVCETDRFPDYFFRYCHMMMFFQCQCLCLDHFKGKLFIGFVQADFLETPG